MDKVLKKSYALIMAIILLAIGLAVFVIFPFEGNSSQSTEVSNTKSFKRSVKKAEKLRKRKKLLRKINNRNAMKSRDAIKSASINTEVEEKKLSELQRTVLQELQNALDAENFKKLLKVLAKFKLSKSEGGLEGDVPKVLRQEAVSALGWFGSLGIPELLGFMADGDEEVAQSAFDLFEAALDDWDMGDRERASILVQAMSALKDVEQIDMLLMSLNNMRNSVKGNAILQVLSSGTPEAQATMRDQLGLYTDADVESVEAVKDWLQKNPDDDDDEEFYGPEKTE